MSRLIFYLLIIATLCLSLSVAQTEKKLETVKEDSVGTTSDATGTDATAADATGSDATAADVPAVEASQDGTINADNAVVAGALRVGSANILVPDASAEHPMIISDPEDQPLCKPLETIAPSRPLKVMDGYEFIVLTNTITNPRKIVIDPANHLLVVSPGQGVFSIRMDKCGNHDVKQILENDQLDQPIGHGLALYGHHLFVATANHVYQFPYSDGQHSPVKDGVKILSNINPENANASPDVAIDIFGHIFVPRSVGDVNEKMDPSHAVIKKFNLKLIPEGGFDYEEHGELQAYGANTYGSMGFDAQARLWGINNLVSSNILRNDISSDHNLVDVGLAEEMNMYEFPKTNYGFPYCMTEYNLKDISTSSKGLGAQWAHPSFMNDSFSLDDYCQESANNHPPAVPLPPKSLASSIYFYMGTFCSVGDLTTHGTSVGLPCNWTDTPIVANHGFSGQAAGHNVVHLPFDDLGHKPRWDKAPEVILEEAEPCSGDGCISPYGLAVDGFGRLLISSDETNEIFMVSRIYNEHAVKILTDRDNALNGDDDDDDEDDEIKPIGDGNKKDDENKSLKDGDKKAGKEDGKKTSKEDDKKASKKDDKKSDKEDDKKDDKKSNKDVNRSSSKNKDIEESNLENDEEGNKNF